MTDWIERFTLHPGTGKAIELKQGQIIRIEQIEGGQCVDFNCFNINDYKERLHVGRTRTAHGIHPSVGDFLWSAAPRERRMMFIAADTSGGLTDTLFPGCSAGLYESRYGFTRHTNCHDIQAEAQREYGLTPDDVHDSFNLFMATSVTNEGRPVIHRQRSKPGDFIELLALMDLLVVPNICGDDVMLNSNFSLKPVQIGIRQATAAERAGVPHNAPLASQRTPSDFLQPNIKADRELRRDHAYTAQFLNVPIATRTMTVELDAETSGQFETLARREVYGDDDGSALRDIFFTWFEEKNHA